MAGESVDLVTRREECRRSKKKKEHYRNGTRTIHPPNTEVPPIQILQRSRTFPLCSEGVPRLSTNPCAVWHTGSRSKKRKTTLIVRCQNHALRFYAPDSRRFKIRNNDDLPPEQASRFELLGQTCDELSGSSFTYVHLKSEKLPGPRDGFRGNDSAHAKVNPAEFLNGYWRGAVNWCRLGFVAGPRLNRSLTPVELTCANLFQVNPGKQGLSFRKPVALGESVPAFRLFQRRK